jgi:serine/threonine protein kinase
MAPEVVLNLPYTEKVDVYSYAMVVWTVARNKPTFMGFDRMMHRKQVVINNERPKFEKGWPTEFCELLTACWSPDPTKRPGFAEVLPKLRAMAAVEESRRGRLKVPTSTGGEPLRGLKHNGRSSVSVL